MKRRMFGLLLLLSFCLSLLVGKLGITTEAAGTEVANGICGEDLVWTLNSEGILSINGTGEMQWENADSWEEYKAQVKSVIISEGVKSIRSYAFSNFYNLTSVVIPQTVTNIEESAFYGCSKLNNISIPNGITSIENHVFDSCMKLTNISIPETVTSIGDGAFNDCRALTNIEIPETVTSIGWGAFSECKRLERIDLPKRIDNIGASAFSGCSSLVDITLPEGMINLESNLFFECSNLKNVKIPSSVTSIEWGAFEKCIGLKSIEIPSGVTSIDNEVFKECSSLTNIKIYNGLTSIGNYAFEGCSSLLSISLPNGITTIGYGAFLNCISLTSVEIPKGVTVIEGRLFQGCCCLSSIKLPENLISIGECAFEGCSGLKSITIPQRVEFIDYGAFRNVSLVHNMSKAEGSPWDANEVHDYAMDICPKCAVPSVITLSSNNTKISLSTTSYTYNGKEKKPSVTVKVDNKTLKNATDYKVSYKNNTYVGEATVTVTGIGNYKGTLSKNFTIKTPGSIKVTFNATGGTVKTSSKNVNRGAKYGELPTPTRKGYDFKGWYTDKSEGKQVSASNYVTESKNQTLYAKWQLKKYSIIYNFNGGSKLSGKTYSTTYTISKEIIFPKASKKGYSFVGWYTDKNFKNKITKISKGSTGNKTLYAKWNANTYKVAFNANGGSGKKMTNQSFTYNASKKALKANTYTKKGYKFIGWATSSSGKVVYKNKQQVQNLTSTNGKTITLYAKWEAVKYSIKYNYNGGYKLGDKDNPITYTVKQSIQFATPGKTGYTFVGWYKDKNFKNKITKISKGSTGNKTLYAKWKANTYKVAFNANGGSGSKMTNQSFTYGASKKALKANTYTKKGYKFAGWATSSSGKVVYKNKQQVQNLTSVNNKTITLYAKWENVNYKISYKAVPETKGISFEDCQKTYTVKQQIKLKNPTLNGYTLKGKWYSDKSCKKSVKTTIEKGQSGDKTYYFKVTSKTPIKYTIKFDGNGKVNNVPVAMICEYDNTYTLPNNSEASVSLWNTKADGTGITYKVGEKINNLLSKDGECIVLYAQVNKKEVKFYTQAPNSTTSWGQFTNDGRIGWSGCALASSAIAFSSVNITVTPGELFIQNGYSVYADWNFFANKNGTTAKSYSGGELNNCLAKYLNDTSGKVSAPIANIHILDSKNNVSSHYVVVIGKDSNGNYIIKDPGTSSDLYSKLIIDGTVRNVSTERHTDNVNQIIQFYK